MPLLEYRCAECASVFERLVPRTQGADVAACPSCAAQGGGRRVLSLFAAVRGSADGGSPAAATPAMGGGCCGGSCGCG